MSLSRRIEAAFFGGTPEFMWSAHESKELNRAQRRVLFCQIAKWLGRSGEDIKLAMEKASSLQARADVASAINTACTISSRDTRSGGAPGFVLRQWMNAILYGDDCGFKDPYAEP